MTIKIQGVDRLFDECLKLRRSRSSAGSTGLRALPDFELGSAVQLHNEGFEVEVGVWYSQIRIPNEVSAMAVRKIAISVPEDVLKRVDKLAKKSKTTRSGFITEVLKQVSSADSRSEIIGKIDSLFGDPEVVKEQRQTSEAFLHAPRKIYGEEEW